MDKSINTIFQEGVGDEEDQVDCDLEGLRQFTFVQNETLNKINNEGIGSFKTFFSKTKAKQSSVELGTGIDEATVGVEPQFVLANKKC